LVRGAKAEGPVVDPGADIGVSVATWDAPRRDEEGASDEIVTLVAAFASHEEAKSAIDAFDAELNPRLEEVVGDAWRDAWKEHFEPFRLSRRIVIQPPWRQAEAGLVAEIPGSRVLELEPGRAFGTGLHESTSLVAQALDDRAEELSGKRLLDVGCGSGILALVALVLGAASARAIDVDEDAARITRENAERNGLSARVSADATDVGALTERFPIVLANIQAEVLVPLAQSISARVEEGGLLILSGILVVQKEKVRAAYPSFALEDAPERGDWVSLVLRAPR
jgi:ribosomal protein L11 methyltransferase